MAILLYEPDQAKMSSSMRKMHRFRCIQRACAVLAGHLLSIDAFYSVQWFC